MIFRSTITLLLILMVGCSTTGEKENDPTTEEDPAATEASANEESDKSAEEAAAKELLAENQAVADLDNVAKEMKPSEFLSSALGEPKKDDGQQNQNMSSISPINRVVRFVAIDGATAFDTPNEKGQVVGTFSQGDGVVVSIQEGWASLSPTKFIKISDLSEVMVPRPKNPAPWMPSSKKVETLQPPAPPPAQTPTAPMLLPGAPIPGA